MRLLLDICISQVFGDFNLADTSFCRGSDDKLLVWSAQRNLVVGKRFSHKWQAAVHLLQKKHSLGPVSPVRIRTVLGVVLACSFLSADSRAFGHGLAVSEAHLR